jgi:DNA-binding transcriptional LysR family regulator
LRADGGIFAVYPHRRYLPAKFRVFVDFLVQWLGGSIELVSFGNKVSGSEL